MKKNFLLNLAYQFLSICIPFVLTPYLSRVFGVVGIGEYTYNLMVVSYFGIFITLGLNNYGNREIAIIKDNKEVLSKTFINIYCMQAIVGLVVLVIYVLYCLTVANSILSWIFIIYLFSYIFDINWFFWGLEEFKLTVTRNTIVKILSTILILWGVKESNDLPLYALIISCTNLISQVVIWPFLNNRIYIHKPAIREIIRHIKPNLILFIPVLGVSLYNIMDKIMLGVLTTSEEVGLYESADKIKSLPILFVTALGTVALPRMSYLFSHMEIEQINRKIANSISLVMFLMSSLCFILIGVGENFVILFFGQEFKAMTSIMYILLPSCFFIGIENVIKNQILIPIGKNKIYIYSIFIGAFLNLTFNYIMIPRIGAIGAAFGTLITEICVCVFQIYKIKDYYNVIKDICNAVVFFVSGVIMLIALIIIELPIESLLLNVFCEGVLAIVIYSIVFIIIKPSVIKECYKKKCGQ